MRRGQGLPGSPDGTLEAVAVKNMDYDYVGAAERYCLERVQRALRGQPGPHHIIELVEALHRTQMATWTSASFASKSLASWACHSQPPDLVITCR